MQPTQFIDPLIFFVPGAWHHSDCFNQVRALLPYPSEAFDHPSIGAFLPTLTLDDDIAALRAALLAHIEAGRQIVLLLHSYGGMVGSSAAHDLSFTHRQSLGLLGGILTIIYLAAFVVPIGSTLQDTLPNGQWHPWMKFYDDFAFSSNEAELFYNDMPPKDQKYWISRLRHHCKGCYTSPARFEAWKEIPTVYVVCENDAAVPEVVQRKWIDDMGESCVKVVEIPSSHSPFLSMPWKVKEAIDVAVKIGREKAGITAD